MRCNPACRPPPERWATHWRITPREEARAAGASDPGVAVLGGSLGVWVSGHMPRRTPNDGPAGGRALIASASREHGTYQVQLSGAYSAPSPRLRHGRRDTADVCRLSRGLGALKEKAVAPRAAHTTPPRGSAAERDGTAADWRRQGTFLPQRQKAFMHIQVKFAQSTLVVGPMRQSTSSG